MSRAKDNMCNLIGRIKTVDVAEKVSKALLLEIGVDTPEPWHWAIYALLMDKRDSLRQKSDKK